MGPSSETHTKRIAFFPPWFLEKKELKKIQRMLPDFYHKRLRYYFDSFGCIRCGRKDVIYCCGGLCSGCQWTIYNRLRKSDKEMKRHYSASKSHPPFLATFKTIQGCTRTASRLQGKNLGACACSASWNVIAAPGSGATYNQEWGNKVFRPVSDAR